MRLLNADGSWSELSGNGLRCLAALVARAEGLKPGATVRIDSDAGVKTLDFLAQDGGRYDFRDGHGPAHRHSTSSDHRRRRDR